MRIDILTLFPDLFTPFLEASFVGAAQRRDSLEIAVHDLRDWASDRHRSVDDSPYGGGPGMLMAPEPLVPAIEALAGEKGQGRTARVLAMSPQGKPLRQADLESLATQTHLVLVCGRYEGFDERALEVAVDEEWSVGDYVLSGGEVPAMVFVEGIARLLPGVLGNPESAVIDSFGGGLLEGPQYTRPPIFRGRSVPEVLRSGDHGAIARWRAEQALERTRTRRPDLMHAHEDAPANGEPKRAEQGVAPSVATEEERSEDTRRRK